MPKIKREEVLKREQFALDIFKKNPQLSVAKANAEIKSVFKSNIRAARMYQLRGMAASGKTVVALATAAKRPILAAARQPGQDNQALPMLVSIDGLGPTKAIATIIDRLRSAGLTNLRVNEGPDNRYVVIDTAG